MFCRILVIAVLLAGSAGAAGAQESTLRGKLVSQEDGLPVAGATVQLRGTVLGAASNSEGVFAIFGVPPGTYDLIVSMVGYKKLQVGGVAVPRDRDSLLFLRLEPSAIQTAPVIISASKHEQEAEEVPVSVAVVDERALVERQTVTVDDALRYVPGVMMTQGQVNIRGTTGYSYGVGSRVLILVDGIPLLSGDTGEIVWESIPVQTIERIEVLKGAGSALYGSSALGGVINIITKPVGDRAETMLRTYGGFYQLPSYQTWDWTSDARTLGGISLMQQGRTGDVAYAVGGSRRVDDGYRQNDFWKRWNFWSTLSYNFSPVQSVTADFSILDQHRGSFLYWKNLNYALQPMDDQLSQQVSSTRWRLGLTYRNTVNDRLSLKMTGGWYHSRWSDNIPTMLDSSGTISRSDAATGEAQATYQVSRSNILTGGIAVNADEVDAGAIFGNRRAYGGALYLQDEIRSESGLLVTPGVRADIQHIAGLESFFRLNPKLGASYALDESTDLRASVASGFRTPAVAEIYTTTEAGGLTFRPNPNLQPERSWSYEIGIRKRWEDFLSLDAAVFRNDVTDLIEPSFGSGGSVQFQNITHAVVTGTEILLRASLVHGMIPLSLGYTYADPEDESGHTVLKYRSRNTFYVSAGTEMAGVRLSADYRYLSKVERIDDQLVYLGIVPDGDVRVPISVLDVNGSVDWTMGSAAMTLSLHVENLLRYYYTEFIGNFGPPRSFVLSLETHLL